MEPSQQTLEEPKGISFFSVKTGETHYGKLEPTIQAYINSSDMGINASRGQDFGWRLDPAWVKRVRAFRRDRTQMSILTAKLQGNKPTTVQILYYLYGEELAAFYEQQEEHENPFEEVYQQAIAAGITVREAAQKAGLPQALADFLNTEEEGDNSDLVDDPTDDDEDGGFLPPDAPSAPPSDPEPDMPIAPQPGGAEVPIPAPAPEPAIPPQT